MPVAVVLGELGEGSLVSELLDRLLAHAAVALGNLGEHRLTTARRAHDSLSFLAIWTSNAQSDSTPRAARTLAAKSRSGAKLNSR
jgi:hypothetical protein